MNIHYDYAREKLFSAIKVLATLSGDVRSRLFVAYSVFHPLKEDNFPNELKKDWRYLFYELHFNKKYFNNL